MTRTLFRPGDERPAGTANPFPGWETTDRLRGVDGTSARTIARSAAEVYGVRLRSGPPGRSGLPVSGSSVEHVGGQWFVDSSDGRLLIAFAERNDYGILLDHDVTLPSGETVHNPMRVIPDGDGCEVVITLRR